MAFYVFLIFSLTHTAVGLQSSGNYRNIHTSSLNYIFGYVK